MHRPAAKSLMLAGLALAVFALGGCQTGVEADEEAGLVADGHVIAQTQCGSCHAVGYSDLSPREDATPLREISRRYSLAVLEEELMKGIKLGHPSMPEFQFSPRGTDALLAYVRHLQLADSEAAKAPASQ